MTIEKLKTFCYKQRYHLRYPYSGPSNTYATDARIMIRVPLIPNVRKDLPLARQSKALFPRNRKKLSAMPKLTKRKSDSIILTPMGHQWFDGRYLKMIPKGAKLFQGEGISDSLYFKFSGGDGILCPLNK